MGEAKLDCSGGHETQTARLNCIKEENGGRPAYEVGKVQSEKSGLGLQGITASVTSSGCSDAGCVTAVGYFRQPNRSARASKQNSWFVPETEQERFSGLAN
jgi:hypothetical protein